MLCNPAIRPPLDLGGTKHSLHVFSWAGPANRVEWERNNPMKPWMPVPSLSYVINRDSYTGRLYLHGNLKPQIPMTQLTDFTSRTIRSQSARPLRYFFANGSTTNSFHRMYCRRTPDGVKLVGYRNPKD